MAQHRIAVMPGDGIGKETVPEGLRVLEAAARKFGIELAFTHFDWSCDYYAKHGRMMPEDWFEQLKPLRGDLLRRRRLAGDGARSRVAVGLADPVPAPFDQYVNMRPCRLMPGIATPLANRKPGDIDFVVVRENTEGEYSSVGGRMCEGTDREIVFQQSVFSRKGVGPHHEVRVRARAHSGRAST